MGLHFLGIFTVGRYCFKNLKEEERFLLKFSSWEGVKISYYQYGQCKGLIMG